MKNDSYAHVVKSKYGYFTVITDSKERVVRIYFPDDKVPQRPNSRKKMPLSVRILENYLKGKKMSSSASIISGNFRSDFEKRVLAELCKIPYGKVITYGELARRAGYPGAARAVGSVMRRNEVPILRPCHRVVSSHGPGGYSKGLNWKKIFWSIEKTQIGQFCDSQ